MTTNVTRPMPAAPSTPRWMSRWLWAAGIYNIAWGGAMGLAPVWTMNRLGVNPPTLELWPQLWACIGMIVGVYGVGYLIASRDPARHWPIVLVGLLGKVLGPIGFVQAALQGQLPWSMGVTILTNDLLWWIPFSMILWHAIQSAWPEPASADVPLDAALGLLRDQQGQSLRAMTDQAATLVVLLRHSGCTFCRQTLADLARQQDAIRKANVQIALIVPADSTQTIQALTNRYQLADAALFSDPDRVLYRALDVGRGTFGQLLGPRVWINGAIAMMQGHGIGKLEGDGFQMPGAFVISHGKVIRAFRHATAGDRPDLQELACSTK